MDLNKLDPFELIEKAHELLDKKEEDDHQDSSYWEAAYNFSLASSVLASKAQQTDENASLKEQKIAALYQDKSHEYLQEARKVLLQAIQHEVKQDQLLLDKIPSRLDIVKLLAGESDDLNLDTNQEFMPFMKGITEEEITMRRELFQTIFIGTDTAVEQNKQQSHEEKELSLQERLAMLDASIPRPKTDQDRINDLTFSLNKLGVYVPDHSTTKKSIDDFADVSEEDQLKQIMNMARDEAQLDIAQGNDEGGIRDVEQILKQASIRIDLDPSPPDYDDLIQGNLNDDNDDDSETREKTATDAEYEFWNNLEIEEEETGEMTETERMKKELANAQSLLLQASLYLEELEEKGVAFESSNDEKEKNESDNANEKKIDIDTVDSSNQSFDEENIVDKDITADEKCDETEDHCKEKEEENEERNKEEFEKEKEEQTQTLNEPFCETMVEKHIDTIAKDEVISDSQDIEERKLHNEGFHKLKEANELVTRIMKSWPSQPRTSM